MNKITVNLEGQSYEVKIRPDPANRSLFTAIVDGKEMSIYVPEPDAPVPLEWIVIDGRPYEIFLDKDLRWIQAAGSRFRIGLRDSTTAVNLPASGDGRIKAPIPGLVTYIFVEPGQEVESGQPLLILEAMKMENEIRAPRSGVVQQILVQPGQSVARDGLLLEVG